uniref:Uncharacterized protein n=1 Tax=Sphaerodactylus townsendi TaxID=933632 RepID=A0ACB8FB52_9SAUR
MKLTINILRPNCYVAFQLMQFSPFQLLRTMHHEDAVWNLKGKFVFSSWIHGWDIWRQDSEDMATGSPVMGRISSSSHVEDRASD